MTRGGKLLLGTDAAFRRARRPLRAVQAGIFVLCLALSAMAAACGSTATSGSGETLQRAARLAQGTLNLEGTDESVDAEAAYRLLPIWELLNDMSTSKTAAPQELAAVVDAIEAAMTVDQLDAIKAMDLPETPIAIMTRTAATDAGSVSADDGTTAGAAMMQPELGLDMDGGMPLDSLAGGEMAGRPVSEAAQGASRVAGGADASDSFGRVLALLRSKTQKS